VNPDRFFRGIMVVGGLYFAFLVAWIVLRNEPSVEAVHLECECREVP
jgi:hypothetical protein